MRAEEDLSTGCRFVFAGGGTGGHLFPALAVVESLRSRLEWVEVSFFCTDRDIDRQVLSTAGVQVVPQRVLPFPSRPWRWLRFLLRWRESVSACVREFSRCRPMVVVGAGGYASGPAVRAAIRLGIPAFLLNPDALPGRANKHFARRGRLKGIFVQWPVSKEHFPPTAPVMVTGCPVRHAFGVVERADRSEIRRSFGLDPRRRTLLITGASQGARTINQAMIQLAGAGLPKQWQVLHLSGSADQEQVQQAYTRAGIAGVVLSFTDRMPEAIAAADLIVSRAGASTLAEILVLGRPAVLLPYPFHRDRHQWHNADVSVKAGAAILVEDQKVARLNASRLLPVLVELMQDDVKRERMAAAARLLGRLEAADQVAEELLEAAREQGHNGC